MSGASTERAPERVYELVGRLRSVLDELERELQRPVAQPPKAGVAPEQFLSITELCDRIPYAEQTIRNLICAGELRNGVHFTQRRRFGKVVFVWSAMERWLREQQLDRSIVEPFTPVHRGRTRKIR